MVYWNNPKEQHKVYITFCELPQLKSTFCLKQVCVCVCWTAIEQTSFTVFMLNEHSTPVYLGKEHVDLKNNNNKKKITCVNLWLRMDILNQSNSSDKSMFLNPRVQVWWIQRLQKAHFTHTQFGFELLNGYK